MTETPTGDFPTGYRCPACGMWVYGGAFHTCCVPAQQTFAPLTGQQGWNCPHCHKAHAPWVQTCPENMATFGITTVGSSQTQGEKP